MQQFVTIRYDNAQRKLSCDNLCAYVLLADRSATQYDWLLA